MKREWQHAPERGDAGALSSMLEAGENVDCRDGYGQTALMLAAHRGHLEAVRVLVGAGADLDHTAKYGLSALMLSVINGHDSVAELLLEAGADIQIRGRGVPGFASKTAFDLAQRLGREQIAERLREASQLRRDQSD